MSNAKSMREAMPTVAALIDDMRSAFGRANIDAVIRRGVGGEPGCFYASENGHTVGTPGLVGVRVGKDARGRSYLLDGPVAGSQAPVKPMTNREKFYSRGQT